MIMYIYTLITYIVYDYEYHYETLTGFKLQNKGWPANKYKNKVYAKRFNFQKILKWN